MPSRSFADAPEVTPSITIGNSGSLAFSVDPGQFNHGSQSITVLTTNYTGYTLTAVPSSGNDSRLENTATPTTSYISSISADKAPSSFSSAEYGFSTDTTITDSTTYHPVTASTKIKETNTATTTEQAGTFQLTIGAKAGSDTPAGSYTRTFTLTASANPVAYAITYNPNVDGQGGSGTAGEVTNMPTPNPQTTGTVVGTTLTLDSSRPTRTGYTFLGWNTNSSATTATYNAGGSYSLDQTTSNQITLYAIWQKAYLQNWTGCDSMNVGDTISLFDNRDDQVYTISKVYMDANHTAANAKCWIMQNLRLDFSNLQEDISASNTNNPTSEFITQASAHPTSDEDEWEPKYDIQFNTAGLGDTTLDPSTGHTYNDNGVYYNWYTATAGNGKSTTAAEENTSGDLCPSGWRLPTGGANGEFADLNTAVNNGSTTSESGLLSVMDFVHSGYYHPVDAIFKTRGDSGELWSSTKADDNVQVYTIMFKSSTVEPGAHLGTIYGGIPIRCIKQAPTHTLTVSFDTSKVASVTVNGQSVSNGATVEMEEGVSHNINMTFSSGYEFDNWSISGTGASVGSTSTQSTTVTIGSTDATPTATAKANALQTWNDCANLSVGSSIQLTDLRDGQSYTVTKYNMGNNTANCWMSNLNLGATDISVDLTGTNTNLPTDGSKDVSASTFNSWKKTSSTGSDTDAEFTPITASNSTTGSDSDSYGNKYGTLYNYCAASAGTICTSSNSSNATYDLCPAGWRLPTGGSSGEYGQLMTGYGGLATYMDSSTTPTGATMSTKLQRELGFPPAGHIYSGSLYDLGYEGSYWTSTRSDSKMTHNMGFILSSKVWPGGTNNRSDGDSVRCIAQKPSHTVTISLGTGVASVIINGQTVADGGTVTMEEGVPLSINMTFDSGYEFDSWSATSGTLGSASTQSTTYTIGSTDATLTANGKAATTFDQAYAAAGKTKVNGYYTMQDMTPDICSDVTPGQSATLIDTRDGQTYTVARWYMDSNQTAANAKCWMSSNLNIGDTANYPLAVTSLTSANTHLALNGSKNVAASTFNSWKKTQSSKSYTNPEFIPVAGQDSNGSKYGTLYNFAAASAGTYTYASGSGTGNAEWDLCPAGWRLPTGGDSGEFKKLVSEAYGIASSAAGSTALQQTLRFPLAGSFYDGAPYDQGTSGTYWSSTRSDGNYMHFIYFTKNYVSPADGYYRYFGDSVRCIADSASRHTLTISLGTGVESVEIGGTSYGNGDTVTLYDNSTNNISMTTSSGYVFNSWSISGSGASVGSTSTKSTTVTIGTANATLAASGKVGTYIQNLTNTQCSQQCASGNCTVYDRRDESDYTVRYLNNQCWMTQNLRITGTITAKDSNNVQWSNFTSPSSFNVSQYDLTNSTYCTGSGTSASTPKGYTNVCSHLDSTGNQYTGNKPTAWYNYAAATAGSITGYSNSTAASRDICPSGWRLPTNTEQSNLRTAISSDITVFSPVYGGYYYNGSPVGASSRGYWWSATASAGLNRYYLRYYDGSLYTGNISRYYGSYVRCVRSS